MRSGHSAVHGKPDFDHPGRATIMTIKNLMLIALLVLIPVRAYPETDAEIRKTHTMIPMRDGIRLSTDIYWPAQDDAPDKLAAILIRTPYNKSERGSVEDAERFARNGFIVAVQDTRGHFGSEGLFGVMHGDAKDGYDTVDWLAGQDWSNGKIGTYGCSYRGAVQIHQAGLRNPHLAAMIPQAAPGGGLGYAGHKPRYLGIRTGGAFVLASTMQFILYAGSKIHYQPPKGTPDELRPILAQYFNPAPTLPEADLQSVLWSLPVIDMPVRAGAMAYTDWNDMLTRGYDDPWWSDSGYLTDKSRTDVPALSIGSWYDPNIEHTLYRFNLLRRNSVSESARKNQFVIISPTQHCNSEEATEKTVVGERDLGDARLGHFEIYQRWFEYWLLGKRNGITDIAPVQYYLMGRNEWKSSNQWPLESTRYEKYFLNSDGQANSRFGDGRLLLQMANENAASDEYIYDPATPVPSKAGPNGSLSGGPMAGPVDQRDLEMRHDILVYSTEPLDDDLEVTGPIKVVLYVSSSARDTDFTAKLLDVYPDGRALNITEGILRARYRDGYAKPVWMEPGLVYELAFELRPTSNAFLRGHQIRLEVSSSNFPRYDRNLNTGGRNYDETEWEIANNKVYHSTKYPSHLVLPTIPRERPFIVDK